MKAMNRTSYLCCICITVISSIFGCVSQLPKNASPIEEQIAPHQMSETPTPISPITPEQPLSEKTPILQKESTPEPRQPDPTNQPQKDILAFVRLASQDAARATLTTGDYGYSSAFEFSQEFDVTFVDNKINGISLQSLFPQGKNIKLFREETDTYKILELVDDSAIEKTENGTAITLTTQGRHLAIAGSERVTFENDSVPEISEQSTESVSVFENTQAVQRVIQSVNKYGIDPSDRRIGVLGMPGYGMENSEDYSGFGRFFRYATNVCSRRDLFNATFKPVVFNGLSELSSYENGKMALSSVVYKDRRRYVLFAFSKGGLDSRAMQLADYWNGKRYIAGKVTAGTPHHGSLLANYAAFCAGIRKQPAQLGLRAAYVAGAAKSFGALPAKLSRTPMKDIIDKSRGRLWKLGFNDLSYNDLLPEIPTLTYFTTLLGGIEVKRTLSPDSKYLSQCNQSTIFLLPGSSKIKRFYDEQGNCFFNYTEALRAFEEEAGLDTAQDTFYHGAYRSGEGLIDARDRFLKMTLQLSGLSYFLGNKSREVVRTAQDFITTIHATMPIVTKDRVSPLAANDSLVALFSALNSLPSLQSLIDLAHSTYVSIGIDMVAVEARKALNALGQYIWKDRRHSELLGYSHEEDPSYVKDKELYETYLNNLFALADKVKGEQITSISAADRDAMFALFTEDLKHCTSGGKPSICEPEEVKILYTQYNGNNIAKMRVWVDWGQNQYMQDGFFEKIGASWELYKREYVPY